jgi:MFS family permease
MLHGRSLARAPLAGAPGRRPRPETARLPSAGPIACSPDMSARYFHGWNVVAATFVMALFSFGLGFYGLSVYVATFQRLLGWSASTVSAPVTVYYVAGALLTTVMGDLYERFGPRVIVAVGSVAMAAGLAALGQVTRPWQLYPAFLLMSVGWGAMSGAAINIILAPWFQRRRGLAVSIAFNGATLGGVFITPALIPLIGAVGFGRALAVSAVVMLVVVLASAAWVMRRSPAELGLGPDGEPAAAAPGAPSGGVEPRWRRDALRTWRFWSVSAPFALGLTAQVGVLTHLVALVAPTLEVNGAARAVSTATAAAVIGRLVTGVLVDRMNRRVVASATLVIQIAGLALLAWTPSVAVVYTGCVLFGLGVGNLTTLPGLVLAAEWPRDRFSHLVGLVVGINQFTFAFGPSLVGVVRDVTGGYPAALGVCAALQALAAVMILLGPGVPRPAHTPRDSPR